MRFLFLTHCWHKNYNVYVSVIILLFWCGWNIDIAVKVCQEMFSGRLIIEQQDPHLHLTLARHSRHPCHMGQLWCTFEGVHFTACVIHML